MILCYVLCSLTADEISILTQQAQAVGPFLSISQFIPLVAAADAMTSRDAQIAKSLQLFDNGQRKGLLDREAFRHAMMTLGDKLSAEEIDTILKDAGEAKGDKKLVEMKSILRLVQQTPV